MKKERKKLDKDLILHRILIGALYLLWGFILLFCTLLLFATTGHCASFSNYNLPFNVAQNSGLNSCLDIDTVITVYESYFVPNVQPYFPNTDFTKSLLFLVDPPNPNNEGFVQVIVIPNPTIVTTFSNDGQYENFDITSNEIYVRPGGRDFTMNLQIDRSISNMYAGSNQFDGDVFIFGSHNTITNVYGNTTIRYPFLLYGLDELKDGSGNYVVLTNNSPVVIPTGHATPPDEFDDPIYPTGSTIPSHVPNLTINNYTWTTVPTPDFSTLEKTAESIYNFLQWLGSNLMGALTNLVNNLSNIGEFIGQTIQYFCTLIIKTIQNGITNFYNNMVSLFEPIASTINYIGQPFDSTALIDAFESMQIYNDYDRCGQLIDDAFGFFDDISEPNTFTIPIDLRSITILHQTEILYFDLGWINSAKNIIRAFMWTVTTFGLLYTVIDSIPDYLQGQDE